MDGDYTLKNSEWRSASGGVVLCAGACVSFYSTTQKSTKVSSTEAEYMSMLRFSARRFSCSISIGLLARTAMLGVPRWERISRGGYI